MLKGNSVISKNKRTSLWNFVLKSGLRHGISIVETGTLKTRDGKTQDWKTWDQIEGVEKAGLENVGSNRRSGKGRTGKRGNIMCMGSEM